MNELICNTSIEDKGFVVILDIHFGKKCNFRLDKTEDIIRNKLLQVIKFCSQNDIRTVIIAGDVFENHSVDRKTFMKAVDIFSLFKDNRIKVYCIYGNHDEYRYNSDFREETPLNDLEKLGVINILKDYEVLNIESNGKKLYSIIGYDYLNTNKIKEHDFKHKFKECGNEESKKIVIGHQFFDNEFLAGKDGITKEEVENSDLDYLILGHDHSYYDAVEIGKTKVLRFGSLVRDTSSKSDLEREPMFVLFDDTLYMRYICLKCQKLKEVIVAKSSVKEREIPSFNEFIEELKIIEKDNEQMKDILMECINNLENEKVKEIIRRNL